MRFSFQVSWTNGSPLQLLICSNIIDLHVGKERSWALTGIKWTSLCQSVFFRGLKVWAGSLMGWDPTARKRAGSQTVNEPSNLVLTSHANRRMDRGGTISLKKTFLIWKPLLRIQQGWSKLEGYIQIHVCNVCISVSLEHKHYEKSFLFCSLSFQYLEKCLAHRGSLTNLQNGRAPSTLPECVRATPWHYHHLEFIGRKWDTRKLSYFLMVIQR